ncbi:MAG: hypothetical protein RLZZ200_127 [Pseudomonadota bacterium]|jgi:uncharacterized protein (TIGR01244 family)
MAAVGLLALWPGAAALAGDEVLGALPQHSRPAAQLHASGQPSADALAALPAAGVKVVIDLRPDEETPDLDEATVVRRSGLVYENLPIAGRAGLNRANVQAFDALLRKHAAVTVLAHCSSSNRVGALLALRAAWIEGRSVAEAIGIGERAGLKGMRPDVEALLSGQSSVDAKDPPAAH